MTIKQLCEWAKKNKVENYNLVLDSEDYGEFIRAEISKWNSHTVLLVAGRGYASKEETNHWLNSEVKEGAQKGK